MAKAAPNDGDISEAAGVIKHQNITAYRTWRGLPVSNILSLLRLHSVLIIRTFVLRKNLQLLPDGLVKAGLSILEESEYLLTPHDAISTVRKCQVVMYCKQHHLCDRGDVFGIQ